MTLLAEVIFANSFICSIVSFIFLESLFRTKDIEESFWGALITAYLNVPVRIFILNISVNVFVDVFVDVFADVFGLFSKNDHTSASSLFNSSFDITHFSTTIIFL